MSSPSLDQISQQLSTMADNLDRIIAGMSTMMNQAGGRSGGSGSGFSGGGGRTGWGGFNPGSGGGVNKNDLLDAMSSGSPLGMAGGVAKAVGGSILGQVKSAVFASYNDLRIGREEALLLERQRLIARGGTGDFTRFQDNLNLAMNQYNVQDRHAFTMDLSNAYASFYSQNMGGGVAGEQRVAGTVGAMHTLAAASGIDAAAVGGAMNSLYSPETYYKAMAAGVMTRNAVTGDMLSPEEIINQYRNRLGTQDPEAIKRALGPGGMLRAELTQTYGDAGLVEMVSRGILMTAETGKPMEVGKMQELAKEAGYFGTDWTQGKDSESKKQAAVQNRVAEYTNDVTAGIKTSNEILADINAAIANLTGVARDAFGMGETMGGLLDTLYQDMPQTTEFLINELKGAFQSFTDALKDLFSGHPLSAGAGLVSAGAQLGGIVLGGGIIGSLISGEADKDPKPSGQYGDQPKPSSGPSGQTVPNAPPVGTGAASGSSPSLSVGKWNVEKDQQVNIHQGEMVLPTRIAQAVRQELTLPVRQAMDIKDSVLPVRQAMNMKPAVVPEYRPMTAVPEKEKQITNKHVSVVINLTVQKATDAEARKFATTVKRYIDQDEELAFVGSGRFG